jgi:cytochrome c-type biogenesis protein CcmH
MMIWLILVLMTAAVMAGLLSPILGKRSGETAADRSEYDRAVFRDQLAELDRDMAKGTIGAAEADAARNEISRRLLQATSGGRAQAMASRAPLIAVIGALLVPAIALPLYLARGNPALPDVPLAARLENALENQDFAALIAKVEKHLADKPGDVQGWQVLAPAYKRAQRWDDAANAYANILKFSSPMPATIADYGEMMVYANQGMVTAEAHRAFTEALKLDPKLPKARFFAGLALKQEGKRDEARMALQSFLADTPAGAPWRPTLEAELKDMESRAPALTQDQMAAGANMTVADRDTMIRSMVDGLEARLKADASDLEGWQRLIRARSVLNEPDKAKAAIATAKEQFKDKPEAISALEGLAREMGIK